MLTKEFLMSSLAWRCPRGKQTDRQSHPCPWAWRQTNDDVARCRDGLWQWSVGARTWHLLTKFGEVLTSVAVFWDVTPCRLVRRYSIAFWKVPRLRPYRWRRVWIIGGMTLTERSQSTRIETCPSATLFTTNLTWTDLGSNPGLHRQRPSTEINLNYI